ncbi:hypothetical protein JCM10212_004165 [Sporobolomyces blumeae]
MSPLDYPELSQQERSIGSALEREHYYEAKVLALSGGPRDFAPAPDRSHLRAAYDDPFGLALSLQSQGHRDLSHKPYGEAWWTKFQHLMLAYVTVSTCEFGPKPVDTKSMNRFASSTAIRILELLASVHGRQHWAAAEAFEDMFSLMLSSLQPV